MLTIHLSATPKGNGYQATVTFPDGVSGKLGGTYPTIAEALTAAAVKLLDMPERLATFDRQARDQRLLASSIRRCRGTRAVRTSK